MPICHDPPAPIDEELDFSKFMDEILVSEIKEKGSREEVLSENRVKKLISENSERPGNRTRYLRKK